jgi:hypothetical protein
MRDMKSISSGVCKGRDSRSVTTTNQKRKCLATWWRRTQTAGRHHLFLFGSTKPFSAKKIKLRLRRLESLPLFVFHKFEDMTTASLSTLGTHADLQKGGLWLCTRQFTTTVTTAARPALWRRSHCINIIERCPPPVVVMELVGWLEPAFIDSSNRPNYNCLDVQRLWSNKIDGVIIKFRFLDSVPLIPFPSCVVYRDRLSFINPPEILYFCGFCQFWNAWSITYPPPLG